MNQKTNEAKEPIWLNPKQLFQRFDLAEPTQAKYRMKKKIPYHKIGSKVFYKLSEINKWIDNAKIN